MIMDQTQQIDFIEHQAVVISTEPARNLVRLRVDDRGDCGSCPAAALCGANGDSANTIEIVSPLASSLRKNDIVTVRGTERMHRKAIMYATVLPCVALVAVMTAVYLICGDQLKAALAGLGTMLLFFIALWAARDRIAHEFTFTITGRPERPGDKKDTLS